jgi:hypothetical protein
VENLHQPLVRWTVVGGWWMMMMMDNNNNGGEGKGIIIIKTRNYLF